MSGGCAQPPAATAVGKYSYAIYLLHSPIRDGLRDLGLSPPASETAGSRWPAQFGFYVVVFAVTFIDAWLSWHLLEKHFLRLKRRFPAAGPTPREWRDAPPVRPRRADQVRISAPRRLAAR